MEDKPFVDKPRFWERWSGLLSEAVRSIKPPFMKLAFVTAGVLLVGLALLGRESAAGYFIPMLLLLALLVILAFVNDYYSMRYRHLERTERALKKALRDIVQDSQLRAQVQAQEHGEEEKTVAAQEVHEEGTSQKSPLKAQAQGQGEDK